MGKHGAVVAPKHGELTRKVTKDHDDEDEFEADDASSSAEEDMEETEPSNVDSATHKKKKKSKAPMEVSATKPVGRFRKIVAVTKKGRDPRFESFTGRLNQELFRKSYAFMDDVRQNEVRQLREQLADEKDEEKREVIRTALQLMQQQLAVQKRKDDEAKVISEAKRAEREKVAQGKRPFFLKESEKRNLVMMSKLEALEKRGGLDKFLEKRLKRRAQKDHKRMPRARIQRGDDAPPQKRRRNDD